ncbi:MAG: hypothetical protein JXB47_09495 [Anaerolineae bacterium]|nr:hypothetical protein [Anaerolineae bacterium]
MLTAKAHATRERCRRRNARTRGDGERAHLRNVPPGDHPTPLVRARGAAFRTHGRDTDAQDARPERPAYLSHPMRPRI